MSIKKKMLHEVKDYFYFTRNEKRGILVISICIVASIFIPGLYSLIEGPARDREIEDLIVSGICCLPDSFRTDSGNQKTRNFNDYHSYKKGLPAPLQFQKKGISGMNYPVIDLNKADSLDLLSLPGIGPYFAKSILRYRKRLGGYVSINQLLEIYGMDKNKLDRLRPNLKVDTVGIVRLSINTADFKTIMKHPYSNYQIAKAIITFRQQYGAITQYDELIRSGVMPDSVFRKILPYLSLQ
jgi:DNA uptake protein ComE-like DNA-binding protein